jgi:hypothetical protein
MVGPKNVIYRYKGHSTSDELEIDKSGKLWFTQGDFISRHGKTWRIESVQEEFFVGEPERLAIVWVYLVSVSVN